MATRYGAETSVFDWRERLVCSRPVVNRTIYAETAALTKELADITGNDRYPFSERSRAVKAILAKLRPEPVREPLPPPKVYAPPRATAQT
jgi:hypothetical protein